MNIRANPLLWRLAEWLYDEIVNPILTDCTKVKGTWETEGTWTRAKYYDKASVLYGKIMTNDFTSDDNHKD